VQNGEHWRGAADHDSDRMHLTGREVEKLTEATKGRRNEVRNRCLLLLMFRHGLRVSAACRMNLRGCGGERYGIIEPNEADVYPY
jgi:site-specific recombinase XerD